MTLADTISSHRQAERAAPAAAWRIDPARSRASFTVRGRLLGLKELTVPGVFTAVAGTIVLDEARPARSRVALAIAAASVDTGIARRDAHLRSADFFDAERFPQIGFVGGAIEAVEPRVGRYRVDGELTIRGVTRPVALDVVYDPSSADGYGRSARFFATGTVDRREFGLTWNPPALMRLVDEVRLAVVIEATPADPLGDVAPVGPAETSP